jgi:hypothetical protein
MTDLPKPGLVDATEPSMTATEMRDCLDAIRWSQHQLARVLEYDAGHIRKKVRGKEPIEPQFAAWLRALARVHRAYPPPRLKPPHDE